MYYVFVGVVVVIVVVVAPLGPTRLNHCVRYDDMHQCPYNMSIFIIVYTRLLSAVISIDQSKMPILRSCLRQEPEQNHKGYSYCKDVRINTITIIPLQVISLRGLKFKSKYLEITIKQNKKKYLFPLRI